MVRLWGKARGSGVKRKVLKINRKEGGVRGLPPGEQSLGEEARP